MEEELQSTQVQQNITPQQVSQIVEPNIPETIDDTYAQMDGYANACTYYMADFENDLNETTHRKMLGGQFGVDLEDSEWSSKSTFANNTGSLSGKSIEMVADLKEMSPNNVSVMKDMLEGFAAGCYEALRSLQEIGAWGGGKIAEMVAGKPIDFDPMKDTEGFGFNQGQSPEMKTSWGNAAKITGQVSTGLLLGGAAAKATKLGGLAKYAKTGWGAKAINALTAAANGFMVDTISFNSNEENLADVLKSLGLPTIEMIAKSEDDSFWTRKIKNGVDGIMAGVLIDFIGKSAKMIYKATPKIIKAGVIAGAVGSDVKGE